MVRTLPAANTVLAWVWDTEATSVVLFFIAAEDSWDQLGTAEDAVHPFEAVAAEGRAWRDGRVTDGGRRLRKCANILMGWTDGVAQKDKHDWHSNPPEGSRSPPPCPLSAGLGH